MNDTELMNRWSALEPSARQRARIETQVFDWLDASDTSIVSEWLALLKVEPLTVFAYASVGAVALVLLTPIGRIAASLLP
jgi:hypothetical protein